MDTDLTRLLAREMAALLRSGETTSRALAEAHLEVAQRQNHALNAWLVIDREGALRQADAADAVLASARRDGPAALVALHPLHGIPVGLKDLISVEGGQCTAGSRILAGYRAPYDAHIVERLRAAGAVFLGKTNMDEFAMGSSNEYSAYGPVSNPWDLDTVPGGSSGGSAAAVAAYHVPLSLGTDTGGSIRQPAALCGVVGMKPTYGRVSRYGIVAFASSLDQIGPLTQDVTDCALLLNAIAGHDRRDATSVPREVPDYTQSLKPDLKGLRLGVPKEYFVEGMQPGVSAVMKAALGKLEELGAALEEISLPHTPYALAVYYIIAPSEASANLARYDGVKYGYSYEADTMWESMEKTRQEGFGAEVKRRIMLGTYALSAGYYDAWYLKAQKVRTLIRREFDAAFQKYDALVTPTSPTVPFRIGEKVDDPLSMYLSDVCTLPINIAGVPAVSVPAGFADGLPVGMQVIGRPFAEETILRVAYAYEQATKWYNKRAKI